MSNKSNSLFYGSVANTANVRVEYAFGESIPFLIGRTAATDPRFINKLPGSNLGVLTGAASGFDAESVRIKAFAELVERISAFEAAFEDNGLVQASLSELKASGASLIIAPSSLQHFADCQQLPPFIDRKPDDSILTWCRGIRICTGETAYVPALAAYLQWQPPIGESLFIWPCATGLAAGTEPKATLRRALLEVIERDACMVSWRIPNYPVFRLRTTIVPEHLQQTCTLLNIVPEVYHVETEGLPDTVVALLFRGSDVRLTCGFACGTLTPELVGKAVSEALMLQWTMCNCQDKSFAIPSQPQTSYQHVAGAFYSGKEVASWYRQQTTRDVLGEKASCPNDLHELARIAEQIFQSPVVAVDVTSSVAKSSGWYVFRVVIPGALPRESDARISHFGGSRLKQLLSRYSMNNQELHTAPHPFG